GVSVAVEVGPLVDEALPASVDDNAERIVVLLESIANGEVAGRRSIHVPLHCVGCRPVTGCGGTDLGRHAVAPTVVEAGATHLGEVPIWTQIAGAHLGVRFKATAGEHHRLGPYFDVLAAAARPHALNAPARADKGHGGGIIEHFDPGPLNSLVQRLDQLRASTQQMARKATPELELTTALERLPA